MRFLEVKEKIGDQLVFTSNDIRKFDSGFCLQRLNEWQKKGYIIKIVKGYYIFSDTQLNEEALFAIANKIYSPSYISLESALMYYSFIPEGVFRLTSVSTKKTNSIDTELGFFDYRKIKPLFFFGYQVAEKGARKFKIATPEKALIDYFYFNSHLKSQNDIKSLRFNRDTFFEKADVSVIRDYIMRLNKKNLEKRINIFLEVLKNA